MFNKPKRRKDKNNPYTLDFNNEKNIYTITFKDNKKQLQTVEVSKDIFEAFNKFELEDISQMHVYERHIEHSYIYEETLEHRSIKKSISIEEEIQDKLLLEDIYNAINNLSEIQKRRIKMYFFENKTVEEIAKIEGTTHQAISKNIRASINEIKKNLKI